MESEQKPKEIKIKLSIDVEDVKKKKWNELTLKERAFKFLGASLAFHFSLKYCCVSLYHLLELLMLW